MAQQNTQPTNQEMPEDTQLPVQGSEAAAPQQSPQQNKEAIWQKIESVYNAARKAYLDGAILPDVIDSFVATLQEIKNTETQNLGGLGADRREVNINESPDGEEAQL